MAATTAAAPWMSLDWPAVNVSARYTAPATGAAFFALR